MRPLWDEDSAGKMLPSVSGSGRVMSSSLETLVSSPMSFFKPASSSPDSSSSSEDGPSSNACSLAAASLSLYLLRSVIAQAPIVRTPGREKTYRIIGVCTVATICNLHGLHLPGRSAHRRRPERPDEAPPESCLRCPLYTRLHVKKSSIGEIQIPIHRIHYGTIFH